MKYMKNMTVSGRGSEGKQFSITITEPCRLLGWKAGDEVTVSVTDDNKIVIAAKDEGTLISPRQQKKNK